MIFSPVIIDKSFAALDLAIGYLPENYVNLAQKFWVVETFSNYQTDKELGKNTWRFVPF